MEKFRSNIALIISVVSLILSGLFVSGIFNKKKFTYVRSADVIYGYTGMKEAQMEFKKRSEAWSMNLDTLKRDYQRAFSDYSKVISKLSPIEKQEREHLLQQQQQSLMDYSKAINDKAKQEDEKITQGVLNQVNSFVTEYGKEKGYDMIFGTTLSGNILYGTEAIDITNEVLEALNKNYKGESLTGNAN